ncbi:unnamed protein product, partial [Ectocarpus sp. 6 AP-2014]
MDVKLSVADNPRFSIQRHPVNSLDIAPSSPPTSRVSPERARQSTGPLSLQPSPFTELNAKHSFPGCESPQATIPRSNQHKYTPSRWWWNKKRAATTHTHATPGVVKAPRLGRPQPPR